MQIFLTGATGYVGAVVAEQLKQAGHEVVGLARSDASATKLTERGITPHRGDLTNPESLADGARQADGVIHLAFQHDFSRFAEVVEDERAVIRAMGDALAGTNKPFVGATGSGYLHRTGDKPVGEDFPIDWNMPLSVRAEAEKDILRFAKRGIRSSVVRLPLYVYGRNGSTFLPGSIAFAREHGFAPFVGDGANRYSVVHVEDAAALFLRAVIDVPSGSLYHAATDHGVTAKQIAEAIGTLTDSPTRSLTRDEADRTFGALVPFLTAENQISAAKAGRELGWGKTVPTTLVDDVTHGSYARAR